MDLGGNSRFEYEGDILIVRCDVSAGQQSYELRWQTDFAYSIRESVTAGTRSFFIMRMFRGGDGHCKESKSVLRVSMKLNMAPDVKVSSCYLDIEE